MAAAASPSPGSAARKQTGPGRVRAPGAFGRRDGLFRFFRPEANLRSLCLTGFKYERVPAGEMSGDLCQYRRAARRRMENVDIRVEFDPGMLPRHVWWAIWDGVAGNVIGQESVALDRQNSAQRFLRFIEDTVVGFHWQW